MLKKVKYEIKIFLTSMMFYTRIRIPFKFEYNQLLLDKCGRYFPLVGFLLSTILVGSYNLMEIYLPTELIAILLLGISILLTGAFHEDGFADFCDGFGGGWTKEKILTIMKDSVLGTYGVTGLILLFLFKFYLWTTLIEQNQFQTAIIFAFPASRFFALTLTKFLSYVRENEDAKAKPVRLSLDNKTWFISFLILPVLGYILHQNWFFWSLFTISQILLLAWFGRYIHKWIGGYTGDTLGALQQISEISIYVLFIAITNS